MSRTEIGGLLIAQGLISRAQLDKALERQHGLGGRLGTCLLETGAVDEEVLLSVLSKQLRVPYATRADLTGISPDLLAMLSAPSAVNCSAVPFRLSAGRIDVALLDPGDLAIEDELSFSLGKPIRPHLATELRITEALNNYYGAPKPLRFQSLLDRENRAGGNGDRNKHGTPEAAELSPVPAYLRPGAVSPGPSSRKPTFTPPSFEKQTIHLTAEERRALEASSHSTRKTPEAGQEASKLGQMLSKAETASNIGLAVIERLSEHFPAVLLFRVSSGREEITGWMGAGEEIDLEWFRHYSVGLYQATIFRDLNAGLSHFAGRLETSPGHHALARCWGGRLEREGIFQPASVRGRMVSALYVNRGDSGLIETDLALMKRAAKLASLAFERCILRRKLQTN